jgi:4-diphosphocytidyl-2-C-methyl-D-erythritol kinase
VPFFLNGGFAFVEGRGESVTPLDYSDSSFAVLVNNGIHINTGFAYEALSRPVSGNVAVPDIRKRDIIERIRFKEQWESIFKNDFEESVFRLYPDLGRIKKAMYSNGAFFASMTGSGSTVFGLFDNENTAEAAGKALTSGGNTVYITKFQSFKNNS